MQMIRREPQLRAGTVDVVIIGAGHSGLAMGRCLAARSIEHVILERGEVANSWRTERWDSLRLLTPNWMSRLPGYAYVGNDPDGYMRMDEVVDFVSAYAASIRAPVHTQTTVTRVERCDAGYRVMTNRGAWRCRAVVIASGAFNTPSVPAVAEHVPGDIDQVTAQRYRNPQQLAQGGVLIVGASATGLQLADEIHRSGRPVTIAVGEHVRLPRMYRGRDIQWWMLASGVLDQGLDEVDDIIRARRVPSPQLVGTPDHATLDLNALIHNGVRVVGRLAGIRGRKAQFSGSLRNVCALADLKMERLLDTIDAWVDANGLAGEAGRKRSYEATKVSKSPLTGLDLGSGEIRTIVWATGYRPDYAWLDVPVLDRRAQIRHDGGIIDSPGMYVMGLPFLRRRKSSFIHGAEDDARDLSSHLAAYLDRSSTRYITRLAV
jgi:putative flavoprotein involved in K+ transport